MEKDEEYRHLVLVALVFGLFDYKLAMFLLEACGD